MNMSYESWKISFQSSEAAAKAAYGDAESEHKKLLLSQLENKNLREAFEAIRKTLHDENDNENGAIQDTIWHGMGETLFDFIDASLSTSLTLDDLNAYVESEIDKFASEVKGLCQDFSSMHGNVYILDVKGAIDGLVELYTKKG
jgi:hypothetical protein